MTKTLFIAVIALLFSCYSYAQDGNVSGKVTDSTGKALELATVTVFKSKDSAVVTYRLTSKDGSFKIPGLPHDLPLRLLVTFSGYEVYRKEFSLTAPAFSQGLGDIKLNPSSKQLEEVIVVAERPPMIIRNDTVEFNANAFKTLPNAMAEDLLKKLNGVEIDKDGNMLINGRRVNRITVEGKRLFGDDSKIVLKNFPANMIDKVQVTDDKDEIAEKNDGDLSNIGKVVNITLKKHTKRKWFGRFNAGIGTDNRYEAGTALNSFKDTLQINIVGNSNNLGGNGRSGLSTSNLASVNMNYTPSKKLSYAARYTLSDSHNDVESENNIRRFSGDTAFNTRTNSQSRSNGMFHNLGFDVNWRRDSLLNFTGRIQYSSSNSSSRTPSATLITNSILGPLSTGASVLSNEGESDNINQNLSLTYRWKHKRTRNISFNQSFGYSNSPRSNITESQNDFYYPVSNKQLINQLRNTKAPTTAFNVNIAYSDALSKKWTLRLTSRVEYAKRGQDQLTYAKDNTSNKYDSLNYALSSSLNRDQLMTENVVGIGYQFNKINISLNAAWQQQWIDNYFGLSRQVNSKQHYSNLLPSISVNWKRFNFNLSKRVNVPSINYLNPVPDNSNPYYISYGNPGLLASRQTSATLNGVFTNVKTGLNFFTSLSFNKTDDAIMMNSVLDNNGIQTTMPINVNGLFNTYFNARVGKQYRPKQGYSFRIDLDLNGGYDRSPILFNGAQSEVNSLRLNPGFGAYVDMNSVVELQSRYSPSFTQSKYSNKQFTDISRVTHNFNAEITVHVPKKVIWRSTVDYRYNPQVSAGLPKSNVYWIGSASLLCFKQSNGEVKVSVYDILNSNNSFYQYLNANSVIDNHANTLQRYFLFSFVYNINPVAPVKKQQPVPARKN
jgi:hypothetical protein